MRLPGKKSGPLARGMREFTDWLVRLFQQPIFLFVTVWGHCAILLGALAFLAAEGQLHHRKLSFFDAYYWAISTATTVGTADLAPVTPTGRAIAILMMVFGSLFLWSYTALFAATFVAPVVSRMGRHVEAEVERVEREVRDDQESLQRLAQQLEAISRSLKEIHEDRDLRRP